MRALGVTCWALLLAACAAGGAPLTRRPDIVPGTFPPPSPARPAPPAPRPPTTAPEAVPEPPPPVVAERPPYLVLIPGSEVYYAPEVPVELFFYNGLWFTLHGGRWFYSADYTGPWTYLSPRGVPPALQHLPAEYRGTPSPPRDGPAGSG